MSKNNVRIAIRDSTDSHNVAFFDNKAGIKYKSANLHRFLAGSASILTIKYNSKDIDSIRSGCKLAFRYKNRDYWLNVMSFEKKGFEVELTAYSLGLELNNETRGEHKPANAMSIAEYVAYYDPEHALTIGVNEVSDKRIKLEWTGTDTILARLFSVANSFGAELDFNVELNDDYSLKRQVLNIYKKGNLGTNKVSQPVRVGKELKVINYSDNIKELRTAVRATGKDGLTIDGLNKKIYDNNKELLYYSSGMTVYAPQSRDRFPSVGKGSNDNWIVKDLGETQYETKEALWGYMYGEIQKISVPEITYEVEGAIDAGIGDTQTLIDDIHFEPALYVQARVSELEDDILTGKVTNSTFINFERKYSQIADSLLKQVEALAEEAAPYIVRLSTDNGYNFKNGQGTSTITAKLEKYSKIVNAKWKWLINNSVVSETSSVKINASQVNGTLNVVAVAIVGGNEAAREYITFTNADDGVGIKSITRYYTTNDKAEGVTAGGQNWSTKPTTPTADKKYMWSYDVITYTNDTSLVTKPAVIGARGDDGLDADTTGITEALEKAKQELTALSANIEKVRNDSLAAVEEAKQQLTTVADDLSKAKTDLQNAVSEVDTKATNLQSDVSNLNTSLSNTAKALQTQGTTLANQAKELQTQASQLTEQAKAQETLTTRVENVETTANGTKTTVSELSKTVTQNGKDITSVSNRTKTVETSLTSAKTSISELQTSVSTAQTDLTNLTKRTKTVEDGLTGTKTNLSELTQTVSNDGKTIASLTSRTKTVEDSVSGLKTTMSSVQKDLTAVTTRTKTVEDDLAGTKTTLSQVQTTANSASQKTATLETGLNGLSAKFDNLKIGGTNLLLYSADPWKAPNDYYQFSGVTKTDEMLNGSIVYKTHTVWASLRSNWGKQLIDRPDVKIGDEFTYSVYVRTDQETPIKARLFFKYSGQSNAEDMTGEKLITQEWQRFTKTFTVTQKMLSDSSKLSWVGFEQTTNSEDGKYVYYACNKIERGNIATDYSPNESDIESKVAEYKQTSDQNYASLQTTVQNLDGTVQANKTTAEQTAAGFKTRIESLETYKSGESTRANQYFESAKTETARQLTAERTAIAKDYLAKSTYTSDVTGIRNDLTATTTTANTTKTNLANYQASNDKAVANLQSNLQTANGNISSLQTKVEAVPGQITSAVSAVEGKILTSVGGRNFWIQSKATGGFVEETLPDNHVTGQKKCYRILNNQKIEFDIEPDFSSRLYQKVTFSAWVKYENVVQGANGWNKFEVFKHTLYRKNSSTGATSSADPVVLAELVGTSDWKYVTYTYDYSNNKSYDQLKTNLRFVLEGVKSGTAWVTGIKVEIGSIPSDYSPAPEDTVTQISNLSSRIQQTADGMTLLATKTELNSAKTELQSGITTATNKANAAQATANSNAQAISTHTTQISALNTGLQAKVSQTDFNTLSGRVTTAENNITAKANELSSKITSVEGKIPTTIGGRNLLTKTNQGKTNWNWVMQAGDKTIESVSSEGINAVKLMKGTATPHSGFSVIYCGGVLSKLIESDTQYTLSFDVYPSVNVTFNATLMDSDSSDRLTTVATMNAAAANKWTKVSCILTRLKNLPANIGGQVVYLTGMSSANGVSYIIKNIKLEKGNIPTDWSPAPEDYDSKLASAQSEIKQTTDAITASVSSVQTAASNAQSTANTAVSKADAAQAGVNTLDSTTVKSASLTINTDGIVMKAGKSTTDVANAIGSYFAVNQNAINLFADKIKVKGDMIVNGAITADKIRAGSITADMFKAARITSLNGATTFDLDSGNITFKKNLATINQVNGNYRSEVSLSSIKASIPAGDWSSVSTIAMDSTSFNTSKRRAGMRVDMMPTYSATLITGETISFAGETESLGTVANSISVLTKASEVDVINKDTKGPSGQWNYPMIMDFGINAAIRVPDIKMGGYTKSLKGILNDLCRKTGILWT